MKSKYELIQEWNELLKSGIITEDDFNKKKQELLKSEKTVSETQNVSSLVKTLKNDILDEEKREYSNKNKIVKISLITFVIGLILLGITYKYINGSLDEETENYIQETESYIEELEPIIHEKNIYNETYTPEFSYYVVEPAHNKRVYFHNKPNYSTRRNAYLVSNEIAYVQQIENGFGYVEFTNPKGQVSKGWLSIQDISYCPDCYHTINNEIKKIDTPIYLNPNNNEAKILSLPNPDSIHKDWENGTIGLSWGFKAESIIINTFGTFYQGRLITSRGSEMEEIYYIISSEWNEI